MIGVEWGIYAVAVAGTLAGAAWLVEGILSKSSTPTRWIWAVGLGLSVAVPLGSLASGTSAPATVGAVVVSSALSDGSAAAAPWSVAGAIDRLVGIVAGPTSEAVAFLVSAVPAGDAVESLFLLFWAGGSLVTACLLLAAHIRLRRRSSTWPRRTVSGTPVRVSASFGPATVGVRRPEIVLPGWAMSLADGERRMVVAHEAAHVAGGDTRLLAAALLPVVVMPWNPATWWMLRRLRDAIELDCDRRALGPEASPATYGRLLVELGRRPASTSMLAAPAIVGRPSLLERRILALKRLRATKPGRAGVAGTVVVCSLAFAVACGTDAPSSESDATGPAAEAPPAPAPDPAPELEPDAPPAPEPEPEPTPEPSRSGNPPAVVPTPDDSGPIPLDGPGVGPISGFPEGDDISARPTFTAYEVAPEIRNRSVVAQALQREYPTTIRDAGIGGRILMHFFIDETGRLRNVQIAESSGLPQLDEAALRVAGVFEFTPALNDGEPTAVWIMVPVTFESR